MKLIDFEVVQETSNHVFFQIQYTNWWSPCKVIYKDYIKNKKNGEIYNRKTFNKPFRSQEMVFNGLIEYHQEIECYKVASIINENK